MRLWINLVAVLLLSALVAMLGVWLSRDPGAIQVQWLGYGVHTSVAFVLIALPLLLLFVWMLDGVFRRFPRAFVERRDQRRRRELAAGLKALLEGRMGNARRLLLKAATLPAQRSLALCAAALAAENHDDPALADELLRTLADSWDEVATVLQARLQRGRGQAGAALANLPATGEPSPNLLLERCLCLLDQQQPGAALALWPQLLAARPLNRARLAQLERRMVAEAMAATADASALESLWNSLDRSQREDLGFTELLARRALALGAGALALEPVEAGLKRSHSESLYALYARLPHPDPRAALKRAVRWLEQQPESSGLRLCLAQLCRQLRLWGKAQEYLEPLLARQPVDTAAWEELGEWGTAQGDLKTARLGFANALRGARGLPPEPWEPGLLRLGKTESDPGADEQLLPEARSVYGFPLPPGG